MSSTVSRNQKFIGEEPSPVEWLEREFNPRRGDDVLWTRELFETIPDHTDLCRTCREDALDDPDAMQWSPHPAWWPQHHTARNGWRPDPLEDFSRGPEYPTHAAKPPGPRSA